MRSFSAVLAGFFTVFIVSRAFDFAFRELHPSYAAPAIIGCGVAVIVLIYGNASILIGGYITGMIARKSYAMHGAILGCLGLVLSIAIDIKYWHQAPTWHHLLGLTLVVPVSAWGAHLAGRRQVRRLIASTG